MPLVNKYIFRLDSATKVLHNDIIKTNRDFIKDYDSRANSKFHSPATSQCEHEKRDFLLTVA